jgi:antitoxin component of MazEF toxin-antitoxin module
MIKRLVKHGNSLALVIDKAILELLKIDAETDISVSTDGHSLVVSPVHDAARAERVRKAIAKGNRKYGKALKRLASQ